MDILRVNTVPYVVLVEFLAHAQVVQFFEKGVRYLGGEIHLCLATVKMNR